MKFKFLDLSTIFNCLLMDHTTKTLLEIINKLSKITVYKKKHTKIWSVQIFLGRGNRIGFVSGLRASGDGNTSEQTGGGTEG